MPKLKSTQSSKAHLFSTWGEDWEGLTTVPSSSTSRMFFVCLFGTAYYLSPGKGGGGRRTLFELELNLPDPAPLYALCYSNDPPS